MDAPPRLHLDPEWVAVDKPAGLASIPEGDLTAPCALNLLAEILGGRLWIVHRLDKEVSGALLFARSAGYHRHLCQAFEHRAVAKRYAAIVQGELAATGGILDFPLRVFGSGRTGVDHERGQPSRTDFAVRKRLNGATVVDIDLHTGRKHQIRAHFYACGHPVLGDRRYGDRQAAAALPRIYLHAQRLTFPTPDGAAVTVEAPLPAEFAELEARLGPPA